MPPLILESLQQLNTYVGKEIATSGWLRMTQQRIQQFAEISGDVQWIHVREAIQLPGEVRQTINYGLNRVRFPAPVRAGEKIRARIGLQSYKDLSGSVEAIFNITMEAEHSAKPCCVAEWILRYFY